MRGVYRPFNFALPSNSLPPAALMPAAVSAVKAAAKLVVKANGGRAGMAGAYSRRYMPALPAQASARAAMALAQRPGMGDTFSDVTGWVKNNKGLAAGIAIGTLLLLGMGRGRR